MTRLWNEPGDFVDEMIEGFVLANRTYVKQVRGGVTRATRSSEPGVALVIGGGSGHYPAFGGLVGPGLAHGAAMGNLFSSPSSVQVESVIRASERGGGVLLSYGNYAGDVLNFTAAQEAVAADGIECRTVLVTDDVFSARPEERSSRRGIAGDLTVFKVAGAAAAEGLDLDDVERVAISANDRTRSMGVAFTGCTLPGADEPLFSVPEGRMAVGLGIHGEPGIDETDIPTADGLAALFVDTLLAEAEIPDGVDLDGARVVPLLNGLGSVKTEELFIVYRRVAALLEERGLTIVDPQVGEFCTSFDMAGASLTLLWLDDELERLWTAPADTPALTRGSVADDSALVDSPDSTASGPEVVPESSPESRDAARQITSILETIVATADRDTVEWGHLDSIAGDGDHGIGMQRGARAALAAAETATTAGAGARTVLTAAAEAWADRAGGTSGALWGVLLRSLAGELSDAASPLASQIAEGVSRGREAVMTVGKAAVGDKTMVDALVPFADALAAEVDSGSDVAAAWRIAAEAATRGAESTAALTPRLGRARTHGDKAVGSQDPGAVSFAAIARAVSEHLDHRPEDEAAGER
ncbi:PTS-dependent dihydroxyacetone kinase, dihydroxyacetone-binding subunit DhaK [Frondihabitans sp. 762G35]|uniref:dihydroxyacetone kinase family protein n=1 Tax=Frondihabitans sp. 762G35 TaxID=1446794 RepID=UPI000D2167AC|nr:dihydroxyacetone kinase family protein [Frondihabitans sp. 762G35]ARC58313.1 PTS-dependent dihydroxyacetone kinase, dihydroxyacetone-binding subunit DhaK [Frondihabitans sp. 762G35]